MRIIILFLMVFSLICIGCASRSEQLAAEYDRISKQSDAVQNELKATVNAQTSADELVQVKAKLVKRIQALAQIQEENSSNGYFSGISIDGDDEPQKLLERLNENYQILSKKMDELREKKGRIAEEQIREKD